MKKKSRKKPAKRTIIFTYKHGKESTAVTRTKVGGAGSVIPDRNVGRVTPRGGEWVMQRRVSDPARSNLDRGRRKGTRNSEFDTV